jgi:hypothetical protein
MLAESINPPSMLECPPDPLGSPLVSHEAQQSDYPETPQSHWWARKPPERPSIVHSSIYLPEPVYEALRKIAFDERVKIHDFVVEGIDAALRSRGYPSAEKLKAGKRR